MTREEKEKKIALGLNRVNRLMAFTEVVNTWNEIDVTMRLVMRGVLTAIQVNQIASQPNQDLKGKMDFTEDELSKAGAIGGVDQYGNITWIKK